MARGLGVYVNCGIEEAGSVGAADPQNVASGRSSDRRDVLFLYGAKRRVGARVPDRRDVLF
ncbi:MAG: hypothetical protein ACR2L8_14935, partial [Solirubrobacteraceae bacterium]